MFAVVGRVYAGDNDVSEDENDGARALDSTGAVIPVGYEADVPVKDAVAPPHDNGATVLRVCVRPARLEPVLSLAPGMWIRPVGCDAPPGGIVLAAGETVRPAHLALLAQVGTRPEDAYVRRRPRVGVLSTGNNVAVGTDDAAGARRRGRIPDANRPLLLE